MSELIRFGVSLDSDLLAQFDSLIERMGYANRSEAVRDLFREKIVEQEWDTPETEIFGVVTIVYDHHTMGVHRRLTELQHASYVHIISTMHVHIDHHNCLELIVLKGLGSEVRSLADKLISLKGVKFGKLNMGTTGQSVK